MIEKTQDQKIDELIADFERKNGLNVTPSAINLFKLILQDGNFQL